MLRKIFMEARLTALKERLGVQWNELAEQIGISVPMLGFLRRGERNPSPKVLLAIEALERSDISTTTATKGELQRWKARAQSAEARAAVAEEKLKIVSEALSLFLQGTAKLKEAVR